MKQIAIGLAALTLLAGGTSPALAQSAGLGDAICIQVLGETAAKLKDSQSTHAVVMNFQGYYTARIRQALGPGGDMGAALKAGRDAVARMSSAEYKSVGGRCLEGAPQKDLEALFVFNDQLGANPPEK
jgi:sulfopyruvate decarboxylase TPP-binding subunit